MLVLEAPLDRLLELVERFQAQRLRERIVNRDRPRRFDRLRRDVELGSLAGELRRSRSWPGNVILTSRVSPALMPMSWSSKPGMKVPDPTLTPTSPPLPPSNGSPSILPAKSMTTRSPFSTLRALPLGGERPVLLGDLVERLVDLGVGDLRDQALELDALEIRELDLRQDLQRDRIGEVGLARR